MAGNRNSGRKRKPAAIRRAEGNPGKREIPDEAEGRGKPKLPLHLTPGERLVWTRTVATAPAGILTGADEMLLEAFAVSVCTYREADKLIKRSSLMVRGAEGTPMANPLLRIRSRAFAEIRACAVELGLSPGARTRLVKAASDEFDPIELLLGSDDDPASAWATTRRQ